MSTTSMSVGKALSTRLQRMHEQLLELAPAVERIACVLYAGRDDMLRTFVNSTRSGVPIQGYESPCGKAPPCRNWPAAATSG